MDETKTLRLAEFYLELRRYEQALEHLAHVPPSNVRGWWLRAKALVELGRMDEAHEAAQRGLAVEPESVELHQLRAVIHLRRDELWPAEQAIREALRLDPHDAWSYGLFGTVLACAGRADEGARMVERALALAPEHDALRLIEAEVALRRGDLTAMRQATAALLAAEPDLAEAHFTHAYGALARHPRQALQHLREAVRLDPARAEWARTARLLGHPLLWLYRYTLPAGFHVARVALAAGFLAWIFGWTSWKPVVAAMVLKLYYVGAFIALARAMQPSAADQASAGHGSRPARPTPPPSS